MPGFSHIMPPQGLVGGLIIGLAAAWMLLANGRVAGCSGLFARATGLAAGGVPRRIALAFTIGLPIGAAIVRLTLGVEAHFPESFGVLATGGLIVGFGTRLGSGCTSGHGVVGLARLSPRSLAATATFVGVGIATATLLRLTGVAP